MPDRKPTPDALSAPDLSKATPRERQFWRTQRPILHDEARESITRLINSHFKNDAERARISIPANPERDGDLIAHSYVEQQRERDAERDELVAALRELADRHFHDPCLSGCRTQELDVDDH